MPLRISICTCVNVHANFSLIHDSCRIHKGCINHQTMIRLLMVIKFGNLIDLNVKFRIFRTWVVLLFFEKPYAQLFCYFFVFSCTFFFIIYSYIVDIFFPVLLVVHMHIFIFDMISPCINVSLMIYLLFPQLLTTPKASLFLLASEHQGSSSLACNPPWCLTINWSKLISRENHFGAGGLLGW